MNNPLKKLFNKKEKEDYTNKTYSQCGEDRILQSLFTQLNILNPSYIDIGANHPTLLSNTNLFYLNGSRGINIEPDVSLLSRFYEQRPKDINLNIGIGLDKEDVIDFYVMTNRVLNTFSKEEAQRIQQYGSYKIESVNKVKVVPLQTIVDRYFTSQNSLDLISIDIEGLDYEVLCSIDLSKYTKTIFCVETLSYAEDKTEEKNNKILDYFKNNGFFVYGDTYINTIFVNKHFWESRTI